MKVTEVINVPSRVKIRGFVPLRVLKIITDHQSVSFVVLNFKMLRNTFQNGLVPFRGQMEWDSCPKNAILVTFMGSLQNFQRSPLSLVYLSFPYPENFTKPFWWQTVMEIYQTLTLHAMA